MSYNAIGVANGDGSVTLYANSNSSGGGSSSNINAVYEETTALAAHSTGTYIYLNNLVYLVTSNIGIGDTITPGTNVSLVTGKGSDTEVYVKDLPGEGGGGGGSSTAEDVSYDIMSYNITGLMNTDGSVTEYGSSAGGGGGSTPSEEWTTITLTSSNWTLDSTTNTYVYSLESLYPSSAYNIKNVLPDSTTTTEMRTAWIAADCGGYEETNIIRCHGTVPTINISIGICIEQFGEVPPAPPGPTIVTWADGTDTEIAAMVAAADAGTIDLSDYWHVGDERTVHLNAMEATGVGESHAAQDVTFVIMNVGGKTLTTATEGGKQTCNFVVGLKNCLNETGYMNSTDTNNGSWSSSARRTWCNSVFKNSLPSTLLPIFKQFQNITAASYNGSTNPTTDDYFALPAAAEVFKGDPTYGKGGSQAGWDTTAYSNLTEFNALSRFTYYETTSNRIKTVNGSANDWWERSPHYNASTNFCLVHSGGAAGYTNASGPGGLAPFGCI